ncbi:hypothetical protein TNCV_73351 [Trichonephila clavipes]|nr:hypothetical protein TNCV_73351 [Trichonephila clavipes]
MCRCFGQSYAKPPVFSSQASLLLIYRPTEGMKGWFDHLQPRILNSGSVARKRETLPLSHWASLFTISKAKYLKVFQRRDHLQSSKDEVTRRFQDFMKIEP